MSRRIHSVTTIDTACFSERRLTAIPGLQRIKTSTLDETEGRRSSGRQVSYIERKP
jgi:hypothetical protein